MNTFNQLPHSIFLYILELADLRAALLAAALVHSSWRPHAQAVLIETLNFGFDAPHDTFKLFIQRRPSNCRVTRFNLFASLKAEITVVLSNTKTV